MARVRRLQNNFTAGEFSPRLVARQDFNKYQNALAELTNFWIYPHGGVTRRLGTRFVKEAKTSTQRVRLIPFEFSVTQAYVLEFGHLYIRFYTLSGSLEDPPGTPVEVVSPYTGAQLEDIHYTQSADVLYLFHPSHQPRKLERTSATVFTLSAIDFNDGPYLDENLDHTKLLSVSGHTGTITINAIGHTPFVSQHIGSVWRLDFGYGWGAVRISAFTSTSQVSAVVEETFGERFEINATDAGQTFRTAVGTDDKLAQGVKFQADTTLFKLEVKLQKIGTPTGNIWLEIRQADLTTVQPLEDAIDVSDKLDVSTIPATAGGTWTTFAFDSPRPGRSPSPILDRGTTYFIVLRGDFAHDVSHHVEWRVSSASIYEDGTAYRQNGTTKSWTDLTADLAVRNIATKQWREAAWSDVRGWPNTGTFFEQRLFLGKDQTFYGSVINDFETFSPTYGQDPPIDENAVAFTVASQQVNTIQWLSGIEDLFVGTAGSEYTIIGANESGIVPTNPPLVREISGYGSARKQPIRAGKNLLYASRARIKLREIGFSLQEDSFNSLDLLLLAEHIGKRQIAEMAYQQDPDPAVWLVMDDGTIGHAAYLKSQDVVGWSKIDTDGLYESVTAIPHPDGDATQIWVVVNRTVDGNALRYIEYFEDRGGEYTGLYVDSGLSYSGAETDNITGLDHLEGKTVTLVGNAAVYPNKVVTGGAITGIDPPITSGDIGLAYTSSLKDLRPAIGDALTSAYALPMGPSKTTITLLASLGLTINGDEIPFRSAGDPMDQPPPVYTGEKDVHLQGVDREAQVHLEQRQPLPCTVLAITRTIETGDI